MKIIKPGVMDLAKWTAQLCCSHCGGGVEITYQDILYEGKTFYFPCPTDRCGVHISLASDRLPKVVRTAVKLNLKTVN